MARKTAEIKSKIVRFTGYVGRKALEGLRKLGK